MPAAECKDQPTGVVTSSTGTTLATLQLAKGYYRTSGESHIVLECYRKDSCVGGLNASNYCAAGYEGPCESNEQHTFHRVPVFVYMGECNYGILGSEMRGGRGE